MADSILVVEDELSLRETLAYNLEKAGYVVHITGNGNEALRLARELRPALILMDLMIPGIDGIEATRILRNEMPVPILILTARDDEIDRVLGLEIGADDYITKPFSMRELIARVKAALRRTNLARPEADTTHIPVLESIVAGDIVVDQTRHEVRRGGRVIPLKPKEYDLLVFLARHKGQVLSREIILERVWGWDFVGGTRTVDVHVRWLRAKLEDDPSHPTRILTIRGAGYRFDG
ncbi:MAG: response regulator transcription factor [Chloroflexi bacterium]|nr:response regulator transcription factor [Chloroflexota bacterium]